MSHGSLKSRTTKFELFLFSLVMIGLVLAVVGLCLNFVSTTFTVLGGVADTKTVPLFGDNIFQQFKEVLSGAGMAEAAKNIHGFEALQAFGIIAVIGIAATLVMSLLKVLTDWRLMKLLLIIVAVLSIAAGVITVVLVFTYVPVDLSGLAAKAIEISSAPAIGGWLVLGGGIVGSAAGFLCAFTK